MHKGGVMDELISRQDAIDALENQKSDWNDDYNIPVRKSIELLVSLPSAQRKGKIIIRSNMLDGEDCYCSKCDHWALLPDYKFCPYCSSLYCSNSIIIRYNKKFCS
jgi:hypothetical protein